MKVKAGALQLVMFIAIVIALLLASFVVFVHMHKRFNIQTDFVVDVIKNTNHGIQHVLENPPPLNKTTMLNESEVFNEVSVMRDFWGVFEKVSMASKIKSKTHKKIALIGAGHDEQNRTALFLKDNNKPLVVVGNTKIKGKTYLPRQGVRSGNISGTSYYGSQLIYGSTGLSFELPQVSKEVMENIEMLLEINNVSQLVNHIDFIEGLKYMRSFHETTSVIYNTEQINLFNISLTGNIIVQSRTRIVVDASSKLKDVLLIAPEIIIKNNVQGSFQAIASKNISIGKRCELEYPSALILKTNLVDDMSSQDNDENIIEVNNNTIVNGTLLYIGESGKNNFNPQVLIEENATINGEIYCDKNVELKGKINGSVYANNFVARQSGSIYQNHIYNGIIDIDELPRQYVGLSFKDSNKGIIKWLY